MKCSPGWGGGTSRRNTRQTQNFYVPMTCDKAGRRALWYRGAKVWQDIPLPLRNRTSTKSFRRAYKKKPCWISNRARRQSGFPTFISCQRQDINVLPKRRQSHQGDKLCDVTTVPLVARWPVFLARASDADGEPQYSDSLIVCGESPESLLAISYTYTPVITAIYILYLHDAQHLIMVLVNWRCKHTLIVFLPIKICVYVYKNK